MEKITVKISKSGTIDIHIEGVKGTRCQTTLAALSEHLGPIEKSGITPEYYEQEVRSEVKQHTSYTP